jgi:transcriptional regulator with XRE-family HTH domain/tetratricopeptide (TPR) repeat protein
MTASTFAELLREHRLAAGLTQDALAERAGLSTRAISDLERGLKQAPRLATVGLLSDALKLSASDRAAFSQSARGTTSTPRAAGRLAVGSEEPPLVGRDREMLAIDRFLGGGGPPVLVFAGEPGIGKSRLLHEAARQAGASELTIVAAGCHRSGGQHPYSPMIDAIEELLDGRGPGGLLSGCEWLVRLMPELAEAALDSSGLPTLPAEQERRLVYRAVQRVLANAAGPRGTLLVLDDLQWAGSGAVDMLAALAHGSHGTPPRILAAYRDTEPAGELEATIADLAARGLAERRRLGALGAGDARALVASVAGAEEIGDRTGLIGRAGGLPFFLVSLARADGESALPWEAEQSVRRRVAPLSTAARELLAAASTIGRVASHELLAAVLEHDDDELVMAIEETTRAQLLVDDGDGDYRFAHDLIREAVEAEISTPRRRLLHRRTAEALERLHPDAERAPVELLAYHFERAGQIGRAVDNLERASERATRVYALREALASLERAITLCDANSSATGDARRIELLRRRAEARAQTSDFAGAIADTDQVLAAARHARDLDAEADALVTLGMIYRRMDAVARARELLSRALAAARTVGNERRVADILYHLGSVAWIEGDNVEATSAHSEAVAIADRLELRDLVGVQAYHGYGEAMFLGADSSPALANFQRSLDLARAIGRRDYECENLLMLGWSAGPMGAGDPPFARRAFLESIEIADRAGLDWHSCPALIGIAYAEIGQGAYVEALDHLEQVQAIIARIGAPRFQAMQLDALGDLLRDIELTREAVAAHERALTRSRESEANFWLPRVLANVAIDNLCLGDRSVAPILGEALEIAERGAMHAHTGRCLEGLAELALARGDALECITVAQRLEQAAESGGLRVWMARARLLTGLGLARQELPAQAMGPLGSALALARELGQSRIQLECHRALADTLGELGRADAAESHRAEAARLESHLADARQRIAPRLRAFGVSPS